MLKKLFPLLVLFFIFYTLFWFRLFNNGNTKEAVQIANKLQRALSTGLDQTFSLRQSTLTPTIEALILPQSYKLEITARKQAFNLSCEFAAAATVLYHYLGKIELAPENEKEAEEILIKKIGVSDNPNLGIRMGATSLDKSILFNNLNQKFGGTEYYGVHLPPFIDLFKQYNLAAIPLDKNKDAVSQIKNAIFRGHLVMVWISIGYGEAIDVELAYGGSVPITKGEHTVVIYGYDENGVFVMDPGIGQNRYIKFQNLLSASYSFALPLLEIYPSSDYFSFDLNVPVDMQTGLDRKNLKIQIENGSGKIGEGNEMKQILKDFGYRIVGVESVKCLDCEEDIRVRMKEKFSNYQNILKNDLELAHYFIKSNSLDISASNSADAVITIGQ